MDYNKLLEDFLNILNQFKQNLFELLPNLLGAILVLAIGFVIARVAKMLTFRLINNLPKLIPQEKVKDKVTGFINEKPIARIIAGVLHWILVFFFLTVATETLGLPVVTIWFSGIVGYLPRILSAVLIGIAGIIAGIILRDLTITTASSAGIVYANLLAQLVQIIVIVVTILIGIELIGVNVSLLESLLIITFGALLFGASVAFAFGARTSVSNILASHYIQKIYKVGDKIRLGEYEGTIIEITPVAVILDSSRGRIYIPAQRFNQENSVLLSKEKI
jgi:hypothetical protein